MIDEAHIDEVVRAISANGVSALQVGALRQRLAGLHLTYCLDDDVCGVEPVREGDGFNLYLVDTRSHCPCFTRDPECASGILVAEVVGDDA